MSHNKTRAMRRSLPNEAYLPKSYLDLVSWFADRGPIQIVDEDADPEATTKHFRDFTNNALQVLEDKELAEVLFSDLTGVVFEEAFKAIEYDALAYEGVVSALDRFIHGVKAIKKF